jgi:signal transduction histidine kinase
VVFRNSSGNPFSGSLSVRVIRHQGRECLQSIVRDITPIVEMQARLRDYAANLEGMVEEKTRHLREANDALSMTVSTLEETRALLAAKSYQAGLAEMAVSVLHNIGNAITPVNIRVGMMAETPFIDPAIFLSLRKIKDLAEDPGALDRDRLESVPKVAAVVSRMLESAQGRLAEDLEFIRKNVHHIREIITRQQRYAGVYGSETLVDLNELLADSLEMLKDSIRKRNIVLDTRLEDLPAVRTDRNKMMQVLLNILKNAYEAIDMAGNGRTHRITVRTGMKLQDGRRFAVMSVEDTGIGITPGVRRQMFSYRFSTKQRQSGFGLHDCANYITSRGGTIECRSQGENLGATILLCLPFDPAGQEAETGQAEAGQESRDRGPQGGSMDQQPIE